MFINKREKYILIVNNIIEELFRSEMRTAYIQKMLCHIFTHIPYQPLGEVHRKVMKIKYITSDEMWKILMNNISVNVTARFQTISSVCTIRPLIINALLVQS